ncbi:transmembrane protein 192-like isoform X2 [Oncorhynchus mykiss]|uniref:transmembrane protein 192-like isoform X2 n=1 Tax=Oncorhynchus mykiss TaxID=8022 RepID=UPI001878188F|nr:transmembrane protein 192-like isoform X2 [Oncorhynchus mykiss]
MESEGMSHHAVSSSVDVSQSVEEDPLVDGPLISHDALQSAIRREFITLPTHCPAVLLLLLQVVYVSLSVCVAVVCVFEVGREECVRVLGNVRGQSVVVIGKVFVWLCVLLFGVCVQHHHSRVRSRGYLRFYRDNRTLKHLPFLIHSAVRVVRFNRDRAGPDISQEEPSNSYNTTETGFREGSSLEEVVEKQADLIDYLKQHNTLLSKRLLNMTVQH